VEPLKDDRSGRDAEDLLELIPRTVRDKLDRSGIKLHLKEWQLLSLPERQRLRDLPCQTDYDVVRYTNEVEQLIRRRTGKLPERLQRKM
jgi:hypothetical protein